MSTRLRDSGLIWRELGPSRRYPGYVHVETVDGTTDAHVPPSYLLNPTARRNDPITSHQAAAAQTPAKVRTEHRLILELLQWEPLSDFELATRASQALGRTVKQTSIGVRRGELVKIGMVRDSGTKGTSDTGSPCIRWALTNFGQSELKAGAA